MYSIRSMTETLSTPEMIYDQAEFFDKLEDGTATLEECKKNQELLRSEGYFYVQGGSFKDPRTRGAEGRVEMQTYDLEDLKKGRVINKPKDEKSQIMLEFTAKDGDRYTATIFHQLGRILKPQEYQQAEPA